MSNWRLLLWPLSWLYGSVLWLRHWAYDNGLFKSSFGPMKTLVFGNLAVGGTGKTPHVAYVIKCIANPETWAFLSRGYGRSTTGFKPVLAASTAAEVGDEPLMLATRYPQMRCFVGEDRLHALQMIQEDFQPEVVVLDDAFQHRRLKPNCAVVLTTWDSPFYRDHLLPAGNLRDLQSRIHYADAVIVSKCPPRLSSNEKHECATKLGLLKHQFVFFTTLTYGEPVPLQHAGVLNPAASFNVISGIANPESFEKYAKSKFSIAHCFRYPDHHVFDASEAQKWLPLETGQPSYVLTTEKDAMRLQHLDLPDQLHIYYIPIEVQFLGDGQEEAFARFVTNKLGI